MPEAEANPRPKRTRHRIAWHCQSPRAHGLKLRHCRFSWPILTRRVSEGPRKSRDSLAYASGCDKSATSKTHAATTTIGGKRSPRRSLKIPWKPDRWQRESYAGSYAALPKPRPRGMNLHIKIPRKYKNINGTANATMLVTSAGVSNIDITKITNTATFQLCT
ncbi:hypothetical protein Rcae01_05381 [Novipirellula caenicola]|uniref:Uncharacterized protein n=1 Tax=Novipirellula caenicola TaxID=1536901 RepID=A0ABP9VYG0_9BACT